MYSPTVKIVCSNFINSLDLLLHVYYSSNLPICTYNYFFTTQLRLFEPLPNQTPLFIMFPKLPIVFLDMLTFDISLARVVRKLPLFHYVGICWLQSSRTSVSNLRLNRVYLWFFHYASLEIFIINTIRIFKITLFISVRRPKSS